MTFIPHLLAEFDNEMRTTRSLLERVPFDSAAWKPHDKSTSLGNLASHVANIVSFGKMIAEQPERNFIGPDGKPTPPTVYSSSEEVLAAFDANVASSRAAIAAVEEKALGDMWTLRAGDRVIFTLPRAVALRTLLMNHIIHHRGQLSVYLRLNEVPLPSIYGPTADT
jgi:uncharacterized damage-inducible protein DinB